MSNLLFMPIIPYFIGVSLPKNFSLESVPVYTFNVDINTFFVNESTNREITADVSFDLTCRPILHNFLKCYVPESSILYASSNDNNTDNEFTLSSLNYWHINFTMEFNYAGLKTFDIEKEDVDNINNLRMIYRKIGDQLSIGADIKSKGDTFYEMESTIIGTCRTFYVLSEDHNLYQLNYALKSLFYGSYFKTNQTRTVEIRKFRSVYNCCSNCSYILGMILWNDLFLTTDFNIRMTHSESLMLVNKHYFSSATNDFFLLYNEKNKLLGRVEENITVILSAVNT